MDRSANDDIAPLDGAIDATKVATESLSRTQWAVVGLFIAFAVAYLGWRATTLNPDAPLFSGLLYGAELFGFATTLLHLFMTHRLSVRQTPPAIENASVDVFIPTFNEPIEIVRRTVLAARRIDYPHQTWLLDDGNRPEMAELARELGVHYLARAENTHAKAGNLNNALAHSSGEFIALFDCDHAPKRNFLHETLGFMRDPRVAFVQTPQDFFNLDSYQHRRSDRRAAVWTEQSLFFRVIQRGKDVWNAAFFCGSCALIRRSALARVGGFATTSITEDLETSVLLHKAGFLSVYVPEPLAYGIAPASASPFLRQRIRWGQGAMQVIKRERLFWRGRLTLAQRLNYMASTLTYFDGWQKAIFYLAPVWVLLTGTMPLVASAGEFLPLFVPYFILTFAMFEEVGRGYGRSALIEQYNMARFAAFVWSTLGLVRRNLRFRVTAKDSHSVRQAEARAVSPQIVVSLLNVFAILGGFAIWTQHRHLPVDGLVANMVWAGVNFVMAFLVVRFTLLRTKFKRRDYRFPVPIPARIAFDGADSLMTVDDVSSSGCRIYGRFPDDVRVGALLQGALQLPDGPLPFVAKVAAKIPGGSEQVRYTKAIGVEFQWTSQRDRDRLDVFLYGSDLQWQMRALSERVRTPSEALIGLFDGTRPGGALENWSAVALADGSVALLGAPMAGGKRLLASFAWIAEGDTLDVAAHTRTGVHPMHLLVVAAMARLSTPTGDIYLSETRDARGGVAANTEDVAVPLAIPA